MGLRLRLRDGEILLGGIVFSGLGIACPGACWSGTACLGQSSRITGGQGLLILDLVSLHVHICIPGCLPLSCYADGLWRILDGVFSNEAAFQILIILDIVARARQGIKYCLDILRGMLIPFLLGDDIGLPLFASLRIDYIIGWNLAVPLNVAICGCLVALLLGLVMQLMREINQFRVRQKIIWLKLVAWPRPLWIRYILHRFGEMETFISLVYATNDILDGIFGLVSIGILRGKLISLSFIEDGLHRAISVHLDEARLN